MIEHLENEVRDELEASRQGQKRAVAVMHLKGERLEVLGRVGPGGAIRLGYSYCGVRMERKTLLTLVCPEQSCPCRVAALAQWEQHQGIVIPAAPQPRFQPMARPLFEEVEIRANGRSCQARPASFRCLTPCPHAAHAAIPMQKAGWDLFQAGRCIAGGVRKNLETGLSAPLMPTLEAAQSWLPISGLRGAARTQPPMVADAYRVGGVKRTPPCPAHMPVARCCAGTGCARHAPPN